MRSIATSSFGPGETNNATSVPSGRVNGPDVPSPSISAAILAAKPIFFLLLPPFLPPPPMPPPRDDLPFRSTANTRQLAPTSSLHRFRACSARPSSWKMHEMPGPPTGWNISTNIRASSRSDLVSWSSVGAPPSLLSASAIRRPPPFFFPAAPFSTPKLAPTGISTSIRLRRCSRAVWTAARHLDTASFTSLGRVGSEPELFLPMPPPRIMLRDVDVDVVHVAHVAHVVLALGLVAAVGWRAFVDEKAWDE
mmetsp:Transcript_19604/g.56423  ORF Transcript_19604/g.56423 Transcript_19604/m.56423 type:complete len:251 (-) Transcript_19604:94-846(-)